MIIQFPLEMIHGENQTPEPDNEERMPRLLYSGIGWKDTFDQMRQLGEVSYGTGPDRKVCLYDSVVTAGGRAVKHTRYSFDSPAVLVVDTEKVGEKIDFRGDYEVRALNIGSFLPCPVTLNAEGKLDSDYFETISHFGKLISEASVEEVQELSDTMLAICIEQ